MELTKENFDDFISRLRYQNRGHGVDDHCTANPIFIVQSKNRICGIDLDYDPEYYWTNNDGECQWTDDEFFSELSEYVEHGGEHDEFDIESDREVTSGNEIIFNKIGYYDHWEYVCAHFTKEGAEAFIKRKSHDHRELRIFIDSQYWCWEFNAIVSGLLDGDIVFKDI